MKPLNHKNIHQKNNADFGLPKKARPFFQPKLTVNAPNDPFEKEADAMADQVMRMTDAQITHEAPPTSIQRKCAACEAAEKEELQRKEEPEEEMLQTQRNKSAATGDDPPPASDQLERQLNGSKGSGSPLPAPILAQMNHALHADFSGVKIHTGAGPAAMNSSIQARAFTHGSDIYFNNNQYNPHQNEGKRLLAHELTHVVQQGRAKPNIQRQSTTRYFGPATTGVPSDWDTQVSGATTPADRARLVQQALGSGVTVVDKTADSAGDASPTAAHLVAFSSGNTVNYDDNLQSKTSPVDRRSLNVNAGYTLESGSNDYIILGRQALDGNDYYQTIVTLNHEFDHVRQHQSHSTLRGNASEVDAWANTFIREFHHNYILGERSSVCFVQRIPQFAPLLMYFASSSVPDTVKNDVVTRIAAYYRSTISPNAGNQKAFRFWIHRTMKNSHNPQLAERLNTELSLGINAADSLATTRQFPCADVPASLALPGAPSLSLPGATSTSTGSGGSGTGSTSGSGRVDRAIQRSPMSFQTATRETIQRVPDESGVNDSPPRYSYSTNCGWIDWAHADTGMTTQLIQAVRDASDRMRTSGATTPELVNAPRMESHGGPIFLSGVTPIVHIKRPLSPDEVLSVALRIFMLQSLGFEALQNWTDSIGSSSFSEEDLPSNLISFYRAARGFNRAHIETTCDVWDSARSLTQIQGYTFQKNGGFRPLSLPSGGAWPADLATITPAVAGGPLMDMPDATFETTLSTFTRGLIGYQIITDGSLRIENLNAGSTIDISGTTSGTANGPHFEVRPLPSGHNLRCRWIIKDSADNRYQMLGDDESSVFRYGSQFNAYINAPTRQLLRDRSVTSATIMCRIIVGAEGADASLQRLLELPVSFTW